MQTPYKTKRKSSAKSLRKKNAEFEQHKQVLVQEANTAADAERTRLMAVAREQADALAAKRQLALEREQQNLQSELRNLASEEVFAIARKALTDLADASLEEKIIETFIGRIQTMDGDAKKAFANALADSRSTNETKQSVLISSAFELQQQQKAAIQTALNTALAADIPLRFETDSKVISGLRLSVNGQQISWSIEDYLASLEKRLGDLLKTVTDKKIPAPKAELPKADVPKFEAPKSAAASTSAAAPQ